MKTKIKYSDLPDGHLIQCTECGRTLPKSCYRCKNINETFERGVCLYCDWKQQNKNIFPIIDGWTQNEIDLAVDFVLTGSSKFVNDLQVVYEKKTLIEVCEMIQQLPLRRRPLFVKGNCEYCDCSIEIPFSSFIKYAHHYCSKECCLKDKPKGADSPYYNRINTTCANCGKEIEVIPFLYKVTNVEGEHHNFCNHKCYSEFRSKYYVGEKSAITGMTHTPEAKKKMRMALAARMQKTERLNTAIQCTVNEILTELDIKFEREKNYKYYAVDNYLTEYNLCIEVMGDYWHVSPFRYNKNKYPVTTKQLEWIKRDKSKHTYIKRYHNIEILYLWEADIKTRPDLCRALIQEYVCCRGVLSEYHSFNYSYENNTLSVNSHRTTPYQEYNASARRALVQDAA